MTKVYLSRTELAERIGVKVPTLARYKLPEPDIIIGSTGRGTRGWLPETVDAWNARRQGPGRPLREVDDTSGAPTG